MIYTKVLSGKLVQLRAVSLDDCNDNYIKYLKDSGGLYDEAKAQLEALVEKDKQVRQQIAQQAEAQLLEARAQKRLQHEVHLHAYPWSVALSYKYQQS